MSEVIISKDFGNVKIKRGGKYKKGLEDFNERYIKQEFGIDETIK